MLILHLQRLVFNFETFQNDKLNSFLEFPNTLDLKPYSYYDVMAKEQRLPKKTEKNEDEEDEAEQVDEEPVKGEKGQEKKEEEEENPEPIEDDCWEYKLVGVNVHSGTANAGHYWSYINTDRRTEDDNGPEWMRTEDDPWMEFNDSTVKDFKFEELEGDCFGDKPGSSSGYGGWGGFGGGRYGKSGYMLFYERKKKKDVKILVTKE